MKKSGTIVRFDLTRGFGFIRSPASSADTFFHLRDWRDALAPRTGLDVAFDEIHVGGKGSRAIAVHAVAS
ncbi:MAG: cold shock domain-containing protein, partial [Polaromonas sp.]|nr:cold shock domain-containing protein [Polaromonas sp.]